MTTGIRRLRPDDSQRTLRLTTDDDELWDARDVARLFKASRSWVYQQTEAGLLPVRRIGGLLRYIPREIRALIDQQQPSSTLNQATQE